MHFNKEARHCWILYLSFLLNVFINTWTFLHEIWKEDSKRSRSHKTTTIFRSESLVITPRGRPLAKRLFNEKLSIATVIWLDSSHWNGIYRITIVKLLTEFLNSCLRSRRNCYLLIPLLQSCQQDSITFLITWLDVVYLVTEK